MTKNMGQVLLIALLGASAGSLLLAEVPKTAKPLSPQEDLGWNQWRGPTRDSVAPSQQWSWKWPKEGPKKLWSINIGVGYASPVVSRGRVFAFGQFNAASSAAWGKRCMATLSGEYKDSKGDCVTCLDAETGRILWRTKVSDGVIRGKIGDVGSTPCTDGKLLFAFAPDATVAALDVATGREVWKTDLAKEQNIQVELWHGALNSPMLVGNVLVLAQGVGLDKNTGKVLWKNPDGWACPADGVDDHYHSPVLCPANDASPGVLLISKTFIRIDPASGRTLCQLDPAPRVGQWYTDPIVLGDRIFYLSNAKTTRLKFTATSMTDDSAGLTRGSGAGDTSNPLVWQNYLYATKVAGDDSGMSGSVNPGQYDSVLQCFDLKDMKPQWIRNGFAGAPIVCDGKLIIQGTWGDVRVVEASPKEFKLLANAKIFDYRGPDPKTPFGAGGWQDASYSMPALVNGRLYCRFTGGDLICLDVSKDYPDADTAVETRRIVGEGLIITGKLGKKPDNAPAYVVGVLTEDASAPGKPAESKGYTLCCQRSGKFHNLQAIAAMAEKGAHVKVAGTLLYDDRIAVNLMEETSESGKTK